jgi:calmodulin
MTDAGAPLVSAADLKALLLDNDLANFDPVAEAFKVYDPSGTGFVELSTLRDVFRRLGFGELSEEDVSVLMTTADKDGDGRISLADFRRILRPDTA